jgi:N6-L-threonylcarbamoyladenine synthase
MLILGIESSCDETAAAVVEDGQRVLSNVIESSAELHAKTGGVVPEVAARAHVTAILPVVQQALAAAKIPIQKIDAIAVTHGPGLASSLLTGVAAANTLASFLGKPLIGVNHILGHIRANWLERDSGAIKYPVVCLTASGGHNELVLLKDENAKPELLGETQDDAAGEAFDKVARLLGLGYPGGPAIQKIAKKGAAEPLPRAWLLPKDVARNWDSVTVGERLRTGKLELANFDFSFSGLKSEVRRRVETRESVIPSGVPTCRDEVEGSRRLSVPDCNSEILRSAQNDNAALAYEFQEAVVDVLATKLLIAAQKFRAAEIHLAGGVSANQRLRARVVELAGQLDSKQQTVAVAAKNLLRSEAEQSEDSQNCQEGERVRVRWPIKMSYCTDNAAMIAGAGYLLYHQDQAKYQKLHLLDAAPNLQL